MHNHEDWSGTRIAAALARLADAGYTQSRLARMAGVNQSTANRWARAERRPGYDAIRRLAVGVWQAYPDLARELVEASGYAWVEPSEVDRSPPPPALTEETKQAMREELGDEMAARLIAHAEHLASGRTPPAGGEGGRRQGGGLAGRRTAG